VARYVRTCLAGEYRGEYNFSLRFGVWWFVIIVDVIMKGGGR
jgi:hypothetical protein